LHYKSKLRRRDREWFTGDSTVICIRASSCSYLSDHYLDFLFMSPCLLLFYVVLRYIRLLDSQRLAGLCCFILSGNHVSQPKPCVFLFCGVFWLISSISLVLPETGWQHYPTRSSALMCLFCSWNLTSSLYLLWRCCGKDWGDWKVKWKRCTQSMWPTWSVLERLEKRFAAPNFDSFFTS
jgi:hypothetical protein